MRIQTQSFSKKACAFLFFCFFFAFQPNLYAQAKEWTFLIYLSGNNNLDYFGKMNINQMEEVGSTDKINIVVQWASLANKTTKRLFITKDNDTKTVTSPVIEDLGHVDMGDWHSVVDFVRWGAKNYPAQHYFLNIWDHGSGWHAIKSLGTNTRSFQHITDISWDDNTGHAISTVQLGQALAESAQIIGHKVDVYGSDACLMAMAEVANEVSNSVEVFAGSEEVEPGAGWPYQTFLKRWASQPQTSATEVGIFLTEEYVKSYSGGVNGKQEVTFSAFDLNHMDHFNTAFSRFGNKLVKLDAGSRTKVMKAASQTQRFTFQDYADLKDFLKNLESAQITELTKEDTGDLRAALNHFVIIDKATSSFSRSGGLSIWLPTSKSIFNNFADRYRKLEFHHNTHWGDVLASLLP